MYDIVSRITKSMNRESKSVKLNREAVYLKLPDREAVLPKSNSQAFLEALPSQTGYWSCPQQVGGGSVILELGNVPHHIWAKNCVAISQNTCTPIGKTLSSMEYFEW